MAEWYTTKSQEYRNEPQSLSRRQPQRCRQLRFQRTAGTGGFDGEESLRVASEQIRITGRSHTGLPCANRKISAVAQRVHYGDARSSSGGSPHAAGRVAARQVAWTTARDSDRLEGQH